MLYIARFNTHYRIFYDSCPPSPWYFRSHMGPSRASFAWKKRLLGWCFEGQSPVHQCRILDSSNGCTMAWFAAWFWRMEQHAPAIYSLERQGNLGKLLETLIIDPDFEWLMIDATHIKVHPHAAGAKGGNQEMSRSKGGSTPRYTWPWMRLVCRSEPLLQRVPQLIAHKLQNLSMA